MATKNVLAGIAVKNLDTSIPWYEKLLGRAPDTTPMKELVEWQFGGGGWLQLFQDATRAGHSSVTLVESSVDDRIAELKSMRIAIKSTISSDLMKLATIHDPDGNQIVFAEGKGPHHRATS